jgi:hypothetical protein
MDITTIQAANPAQNISINAANNFQAYLTSLNLAFTSMYAISPNSQGPAGQYTIPQLLAVGIDPNAPIFLQGTTVSTAGNMVGRTKSNVIALCVALIAGFDGVESYIKLFNDFNSGTSVEDAENALENNMPAVDEEIVTTLNSYKTANNIA